MDLHTGCSLWQGLRTEPVDYPTLENDLKCEIAIIGGGITGALLSYTLSKEGIEVVLIDKRNPATGSTSASTGLLQFEVDTPLVDLIDKVGQQNAVHAYHRGIQAIDEIEEILSHLNGNFDFRRRKSLLLASNEKDSKDLQKNLNA